jgi:hypothetical protein
MNSASSNPNNAFLTSALLSLAFVLALAGCSPGNPSLEAPAEAPEAVEAMEAPVSAKAKFVPKVDILFVVDNSNSMLKHQENLKRNINRFVEAFDKKSNVDFQIGVVSVYDSGRLNKSHPSYLENGRLRPLKDPREPGKLFDGPQLVRRDAGYADILGETLKIGVFAYEEGGPEIEELFSPILAAFKPGLNPGFIRRDAHLAIVFLSDVDDASPNLSGDALYASLLRAKGEESRMISSYGALALNPKGRKVCKPDPGLVDRRTGEWLSPEKVLSFIQTSNGPAYDRVQNPHVFSLCDQRFGDRLAVVGKQIQERASSHVRMPLKRVPQHGTLKVRVAGGRELVPGLEFKYDPNNPAIVIQDGDRIPELAEGGQIEVEMIPVDFRKLLSGQGQTVR